jgi:hypothetical protein
MVFKFVRNCHLLLTSGHAHQQTGPQEEPATSDLVEEDFEYLLLLGSAGRYLKFPSWPRTEGAVVY